MYNLNSSEITDRSQFLSINQQNLASLLTFVDFAAGLTIGFIEIDREQERDWIVEWLIDLPQCQNVNFLVLNYDDPSLRFLLDEILKSLSQQDLQNIEKLVLIIKGLEHSIGHGEYPPILQNLNFVRDAFVDALPYPILFCLPSYQITSVAKFAPDFWAWKSGSFKFESVERELILASSLPVEYSPDWRTPEPQSRIDLLEKLLLEHLGSVSKSDLSTVVSILQQLGNARRSRQEFEMAEIYLVEALNIIKENPSLCPAKTNLWIELADVYREQRKYDLSAELCEQVLNLDRSGRYLLSLLQWIEVNNILGLVCTNNPQGNLADNLEKAIGCFQSVLTFSIYEDFPKDWAMTQNNLANAYRVRIKGDRGDNIEWAISCYMAAMTVFTIENFPQHWAMIQNNLAIVYIERIKGSRRENIEGAISGFEAALIIYTAEISAQAWAKTQYYLGLAYTQRIMGKKAENIKRAIECYQNALKIYTPDTFPREWKLTQNLLNAISDDSIS
jgi:tetratricopeptide (TPR) repeat protein